jgi:transposase
MKKYRVKLSDEERAALHRLTRLGKRGKTTARKMTRARTLLLADQGASDAEISATLGVGLLTVERTRWRFNEARLASLEDRPRPGGPHLLSKKAEARLVAEARRAPPAGHERWTLRLLARRVVELGLADACSHETVRRVLRRRGVSLKKLFVKPRRGGMK